MNLIPHSRTLHVFHGEKLWVDPQWKNALAEVGIQPGADWSRLSSEDAVSGSYNTTANFRFRLKSGRTVYFKRYVYRKFRFKHWLQPSKAAVEAAGYHDLEQLGINTIETLAYGERRRLGLLRACCIVTLGEENTVELDQFLARTWFKQNHAEKRRQLLPIQATLINQLKLAHQGGFYHWDLKLRNILLLKDERFSTLIWIDCPRSRFKASNDEKSIIHELASLARVGVRVLTPGQRLRFLLGYTNNNRDRARALYRAIGRVLSEKPPRPYWQLLPNDDPAFIAEFEKMEKQS